MHTVSTDWLSLLTLTFLLGMKHGFDADHLSTIDGMTRYNAAARPGLARYCGTLFSLGHGAVVLAIALGISATTSRWEVPDWLNTFGALTSIVFLATLGLLNLSAVLRTRPDAIVQPVGIKGRALGRLRNASHPLFVALVGALFALSFDTLSQAAFFALTATRFGGWPQALLLALLFMSGMLMTDGINGLWIARLIARADRTALLASRVMGLVVSFLSLAVSAFGMLKLASPGIEAWSGGKELVFGFGVVGVIGSSFLLALGLSRRLPVSLPGGR